MGLLASGLERRRRGHRDRSRGSPRRGKERVAETARPAGGRGTAHRCISGAHSDQHPRERPVRTDTDQQQAQSISHTALTVSLTWSELGGTIGVGTGAACAASARAAR